MLLLGLGVWTVMNAAGQAIAALFNGARVIRFQVWSALSMAVTNIVLSVILARHVGLPGIIWGTVISYGVCCVVPWFFFVPRLLKRLEAPPAAAPGSAFAR